MPSTIGYIVIGFVVVILLLAALFLIRNRMLQRANVLPPQFLRSLTAAQRALPHITQVELYLDQLIRDHDRNRYGSGFVSPTQRVLPTFMEEVEYTRRNSQSRPRKM